MTVVYDRFGVQVRHGACLDVLRTMLGNSVHAVVTDPPYGLEFMGKEWDTFKPGGKRPGFGKPDGSKYRQNMGTPSWGANGNPTCRNCGGDKYRNGPRKCSCDNPDFPNHMANHMRVYQAWCEQWAKECLRVLAPGGHLLAFGGTRTSHRLACGIEDAGFEIRDEIDVIGSRISWMYASGFPKSRDVLKPSHEPIIVARKPLTSTVAASVLEHGTGGLNVGACRVGTTDSLNGGAYSGDRRSRPQDCLEGGPLRNGIGEYEQPAGRWPPNTVLSHVPLLDAGGEVIGDACADGCMAGCAVAELGAQGGVRTSGLFKGPRAADKFRTAYGEFKGDASREVETYGDSGSAARFFPCFRFEAKAPTAERPRVNGQSHATVKPVALLRWMARLVTPPGGTILDCFAGTGTTGQAARAEGFPAILIEDDPDSIPLIVARLDAKPRTEAPKPDAAPTDPEGDLFDLLGLAEGT